MIIYKVTNKINGKIYIGQTIHSMEDRWTQHCSEKSCCRRLKHSILKYGKDNFIIEQIDSAKSLEELNKKEEYWIKELNSLVPNGYNLIQGGNNRQPSEETLKKRSDSMKGKNTYKKTEEHKQKISQNRKGVKLNPKSEKKRLEKLREKHCRSIIDCSTGQEYFSIKEAANKLQLNTANISQNLNGTNSICAGKVFKYTEDWDGKLIPINKLGNLKVARKVVCVETGIIYENYREIAEKLKLKPKCVQAAITSGRVLKNRHFKPLDKWDGKIIQLKELKKTWSIRKVICLETGIVYENSRDTADKLNLRAASIRSAISDNHSLHGYHFKYIDNTNEPIKDPTCSI